VKNKCYRKSTSPFVSTLENPEDIKCIILYGHNRVKDKIDGEKYENLKVLQIIHENNITNKSIGEDVQINLKEFF